MALLCAMSMLLTMVTAVAEGTATVPEYDFDLFKDGVLAGTLDTATATGITVTDKTMTILPKWSDQKIVFATPIDITSLTSTGMKLRMNIKADALRNEANSTATMEAIIYDVNGYRKMCGAPTTAIKTTASDIEWASWYRPSSENGTTFDDSNIVAIAVRVYPNDTYNATSFTVNKITLDFDALEAEPDEEPTEPEEPTEAVVPEYDFDLYKEGLLSGTLDTSIPNGITLSNDGMKIAPQWTYDSKIIFDAPIDISSLTSKAIKVKMNIKADGLRGETKDTASMAVMLYDGNGTRNIYWSPSSGITTTAGNVEWANPSVNPTDATFDYSNIVAIAFRAYPNDDYNATGFTVNSILLDFDGLNTYIPPKAAQVPEYDVTVFANGTPNGIYDESNRMYINEDNNLQINSVDWTDRWITFDTPVNLSTYSSSFTLKIKTKVNELTQGSSGELIVFLKDADEKRLQGVVSNIGDSFAEYVITPTYQMDGSFDFSNIKYFGFRTYPASINGSSIEFERIIIDIASLNSGVKVLGADEVLNDGTFTAYSLVDTQKTFVTIETAQRAENDSYVKITPLKSWGITTYHIFDYAFDASECKDTVALKLDVKSDGDNVSGGTPTVKIAINDKDGNKIVFDKSSTVTEQWQTMTLKLEDGVKNDENSDEFDYSNITQMFFYLNGPAYGIDNVMIVPTASQPEPVVSTKLYVADWETSEGEYKEAQTFTVGDDMQIVTTVENAVNYGVVLAYYVGNVLESVEIKPYNETGVYTFEEVYSENADKIKVFVWDMTMLPIGGAEAEFIAQ